MTSKMTESVIKMLTAPNGFRYMKDGLDRRRPYIAMSDKRYYSPRYKKYVTVKSGMRADGATGAIDIPSFAWWVHDKLCNTGQFDDGTRCTNWQASMVLKDILKSEGRWVRDWWWLWATFLFGGGEARKNGMWRLKYRH